MEPLTFKNKETSCFFIQWVHTNFKVIKVFKFLVFLLMELQEFLQKFGIMTINQFTVFLNIQDGSRFWFYFVDIKVELAGYLVWVLGAFYIIFLSFDLSGFDLLFGKSESVLDAELVVTTLLLPEFFQFFSLCYGEHEWFLLNCHLFGSKLVDQIFLDP